MTSSANPPARLSAAVKLLLLFAAVAVAGLIVPFWVDPAIGKSGTAWRQGFGALAVSIVGLSGLLLWIARMRGPIQAFCLVFGVLAGLCLVVDAAIGLAVFDYGVSRDAAVALRIVRVVPGAAALAAVAGCMLGFFAGTALSFVQRRAKKSASTNAASGRAVSGPRQWVRSWTSRCSSRPSTSRWMGAARVAKSRRHGFSDRGRAVLIGVCEGH